MCLKVLPVAISIAFLQAATMALSNIYLLSVDNTTRVYLKVVQQRW